MGHITGSWQPIKVVKSFIILLTFPNVSNKDIQCSITFPLSYIVFIELKKRKKKALICPLDIAIEKNLTLVVEL